MPRTCNAPVPVGAGALLRLRAGEVAQNMPGWLRRAGVPGSGGGAGDPSREVSGEAARVRIMVRYILERRQPEPPAGFACGVDCLPFCWTLDS